MNSQIWKNVNYRSGVQFLIDTPLIEYDISKADISVLRDANILSEEEYQYFLVAPKKERNIAIGKLRGRCPEVTTILKNGIENARKIFIESNNIQNSNILEIRNDAIIIIGREAEHLKITDRVSFRPVGNYTSFYKINEVEYFYFYDIVSKTELLDIKGLGDEAIALHKNYMLDFLLELFYTSQIEGPKQAITLLSYFHTNYINKDLDIGYYRELRSMSKFKLIDNASMVGSIFADSLTNYDKRYIDIGFNENILRYLIRIYASIYFGKR